MPLNQLMILLTAVLKTEIAVAMAVNGTNPPTQLPSAPFSYVSGPFMNGPSITWEKAYNAITVGTVVVTVHKNSSQIGSTTIYGTEYTNSPNASLYRPESTNSAGTRTSDGWRTTPRMTYPANYYGPRSELTWAAVLPITTPGLYSQLRADNWEDQYPFEYNIPDVGKEGTCCFTSFIVQPMPTSMRIVQDTESTDLEDPRGCLYTVATAHWWTHESYHRLQPTQVSSLFPHMPLEVTYIPCSHAACTATSILQKTFWVAPPSFARPAASILATSTSVIDV